MTMKLTDVEQMARDLMEDPTAKALLEDEFNKLLGEDIGNKRTNTELDNIYKKLKENFEHLVTPLGSEDNDKE
jgi:hypothetical protein